MRLSVVHETLYRYDQAVESSHHLAHLSPQSDAMQTVHAHRIDIDPAPTCGDLTQRVDRWGNLATHWFMAQAHPHLRVAAYSQIETRVCPEAISEISCQQASRLLHQDLKLGRAEALRWVYPSIRVPQHPEFSDLARPDLAPERPLVEAAVAFMQRLHGQFTYDAQSTQVHTPALSALREQRGVCQDFAHIMLAGLRQMGQAACYVSGYLLTHPPPGQARLRGADASHAWVALHIPHLNDHPSRGWLHLDPTNARYGWGSPGADYVVLARGRDFSDVSPLRGVLRGGSDSAPRVSVHVEPI
jgi:transglutaminase-like putative cysteine protease